ncbi:MAG: class I tRNA ligase family protein, partial [Eubacterium sp.]|nr:class I tRNA ligase family protein [Eubacterium sp.]
GSSWYFLRYVDVHNDKELISREKADKYLPVDMYIGGVEHAVLHLLYSRFWTKFLYDIGVVGFDEPFKKLFNQGMICGRDKVTGKPTKMSKSLGNIVSPDDIVRDYGCDTLRLYELFVGPPEADAIWDDAGIDGIYRFIKRFYGVVTDNVEKYANDGEVAETPETLRLRNGLVKAVTERLESFNLNTVVSAFMEYNNKFVDMTKSEGIDRETLKTAVKLIAPFAPHIGEELWEVLGGTGSVFAEMWPECDEKHLVSDELTLPVQVSGKTRLTINVPADASKDEILAAAKEALGARLEGKTIVKEIYVPGKIINIVAK